MRLTIVGSGDAFGSGGRLQTCFHVETAAGPFLIDCGATALIGFNRLGLDPNGVGRKTANLVLTLGFKAQGICVDTHVHRITNRWGYVRTKTPNDTEQALRKKLPPEHWIEINAQESKRHPVIRSKLPPLDGAEARRRELGF